MLVEGGPSLTASLNEASSRDVWARAAWTSRCGSDERDDEAAAHGWDRVRHVTLGSKRQRLGVCNRREAQVA